MCARRTDRIEGHAQAGRGNDSEDSARPPLLPPRMTALRLGLVGSTVGPLVDSLHNQCLLAYGYLPITFQLDDASPPLFASSWVVPPLLGLAYIVLGYILPQMVDFVLPKPERNGIASAGGDSTTSSSLPVLAVLAVSSTALTIKLSEFLTTHDVIDIASQTITLDGQTSLGIMAAMDVVQWLTLDRSIVSLVVASITSVGGPLSELPFVANGFWHYLPQSSDYFPLSGVQGNFIEQLATTVLGEDFRSIALSSITGPCYFAVTLDAIALGRYFYSQERCDEKSNV